MKLSGAMIIRNGVKLGYPFLESLRSILPFCDEVVVGVGDSEDGTREALTALNDGRIRLIDSVWDMTKREGGTILSLETNKVLTHCSGDWIFYIQADEVFMEKDHARVLDAVKRANGRADIDGIAFDYLHFYGSYFTVQEGKNWYAREVRLIKNGLGIVSHGDAQGFRKDGRKVRALASGARMYHYGWARPPEKMLEKLRSFHRFWHDDAWVEQNCSSSDLAHYFSDLGNLASFTGEHPRAMEATVNRDSEKFIGQCREKYLKSRTLSRAARDFLRRLPVGEHRNFILTK